MQPANRTVRPGAASAAAAVGFVVLAALVQATDFDRLNAFALRHLQPLASGHGHPRLTDLAEAVVAPGAPFAAALLILAASALLLLRGRPAAAAAWPAALVCALVIELACKLVIGQHRSAVWHGFGMTFDSSFPSGHMLRAILIAGVASALWPSLRLPLGAWCALVAVCMLVTGFHLPTDILGGVLAGLALALAAEAVERRTSGRGGFPTRGSGRTLEG